MDDAFLSAHIERRIPDFAPGATFVRAWPLRGGISAKMVAFELRLADGAVTTLVARQPSLAKFDANSEVAAEEFRVLTAVHAAGVRTPRPLYLSPPSVGAPQPFFVVEYVQGRPEVDPPDPGDYLDRYAKQLAAIHQVDLTRYDLAFLPRQDRGYGLGGETRNEALRESAIRDALASIPPIVASNPPVLRHGDFWPGNVLWHEGEIVGVVDWEDALVGEPLADLAICRLDLWWVLGREAAFDFTRRYQALTRIDLKDLPYWDLCASLRPISNLSEWAASYPDLGRPDITEATMARDHQEFVAQALAHF
ncbi:MAG: phosphotransferase family protein [Fimbriimonas sp.]